MNLEYYPEARADVQKAYDWYDECSYEAAEGFRASLNYTLGKITENPNAYGYVKGTVKVASLKRFPYAVYFEVELDRVKIIAVMHHSRNPRIWKKRLQ